MAGRAGVKDANFKRFRHSLSTHGKQRFGMTAEQVRAQLRHTTTDTQKHYDHDDLANLRDAVKGVDFEGKRAAPRQRWPPASTEVPAHLLLRRRVSASRQGWCRRTSTASPGAD